MQAVPAYSIRPLVDRLLDGKLTDFLVEHRSQGDSYNTIANQLRSIADVDVTAETIRNWCDQDGITKGQPEAVA